MPIVIRYGHARCALVEGHSKHFIGALRFDDPAARFDRDVQEGLSDGKVLFYDRTTRTFPTGFLPRVVRRLERKAKRFRIEYPDGEPAPISLKGIHADMLFGITLRDHQVRGVRAVFTHCRGFVWHATNAGKSPQAAAIGLHVKRKLGAPTLVVVPNTGLLHSTAKEIQRLCGGEVRVSKIGDGSKNTTGDILVATFQTIVRGCPSYVEEYNNRRRRTTSALKRKKSKRAGQTVKLNKKLMRMLRKVAAVVIDEAHHVGADTYRHILDTAENARIRVGMTGTMKTRNKIRDLTLKAYIGPMIDRATNEEMIEKGYSAKPVIYLYKDRDVFRRDLSEPKKQVRFKNRAGEWQVKWLPEGRERHRRELKRLLHDHEYNRAIVRICRAFHRGGLKPGVLTTSLNQIRMLAALLKEKGLHPVVVWGDVKGKRRAALIKRFTLDPDAVLLGSTVFDEGQNAPALGMLLLAGQGKGVVQLLQRVGRGLRQKTSGLNFVAIVDMFATNGEYLPDHSEERRLIYEAEKFEIEPIKDTDEFLRRARGGWEGLLGHKRYARERAKQKRGSSAA